MLTYEKNRIEKAIRVVEEKCRRVLFDDFYKDEDLDQLIRALEFLTEKANDK